MWRGSRDDGDAAQTMGVPETVRWGSRGTGTEAVHGCRAQRVGGVRGVERGGQEGDVRSVLDEIEARECRDGRREERVCCGAGACVVVRWLGQRGVEEGAEGRGQADETGLGAPETRLMKVRERTAQYGSLPVGARQP